MKFKFKTKHIAEAPLNGILTERFVIAAIETCKTLNWQIRYISAHGVIAYSVPSPKGRFEEVIIRKDDEDTMVIQSMSTHKPLHDGGKNEQNTETFINAFNAIKLQLSDEYVYEVLQSISNGLPLPQNDILSPGLFTKLTKKEPFLSFLKPKEGFIATPVLAAINILVFIIMLAAGVDLVTPTTESIFRWGGNWGPATLNGEWWRIISSAFVHIGIIHLLMNMYALVFTGVILEPVLGKTRFAAAYLLTAATSGLMALYMHPQTVSAGASGAIFGLLGVYIALLTTSAIDKQTRKKMLPIMGLYVLYNLANGMKDGIDNAGHIGGLIGGLVTGYAYYFSLKNKKRKGLKYITISVLAVLVLAVSTFAFNKLPETVQAKQKDFVVYQEKMKYFHDLENKALEIYKPGADTTRTVMLAAIKDKGIAYWDECNAVLNSVGKLDIPYDAKARNKRLKEYVGLRKESYQLIYKQMLENTTSYNTRLKTIDSNINNIILSMQAPQ